MPVVMMIELTARPGAMPELRGFLRPQETRAFEGNLGVEVTVDAEDENRLVLLARWATGDAMRAYLASRDAAGQARLFELLEGGREGFKLRTLEVVESPRRQRSKTREEALEDLE